MYKLNVNLNHSDGAFDLYTAFSLSWASFVCLCSVYNWKGSLYG